jgi:hypothetical protein
MLNSENQEEVYQSNKTTIESGQLGPKELLEQVLKCLKTLISFKENQLQKGIL